MSASDAVRSVFWNAAERRPRTPWRLVLGLVGLVLGGLAGLLLAGILAALAPSVAPPIVTAVVGVGGQVLAMGALAAGLLAAGWLVDRRTLRDFGLGADRAWWLDLAFGLALGVALPAAVFALELATGLLAVTGTAATRPDPSLPIAPDVPFAAAFALTFVYFVGVGVVEEVVFRSYLLTNVAEGLRGVGDVGARWALVAAAVLTSLLFGIGHATNPNATALSSLLIAVYGVFIAATYLVTARVAIAIGFHVTWNFTLSSVFGFPVSGLTTPVTAIAVEQRGPEIVTGGEFGPEAGLISVVSMGIGIALLAWWVRRREGDLTLHEDVAIPELRTEGPLLSIRE